MFRYIYNTQKYNKILIKLFLSFQLFSLALYPNSALRAMYNFEDQSEEDLYNKGVTYQRDKKFKEAIECFKPLAEKKYAKAQHNLALCYHSIDQNQDAYVWYRRASNQGFEPSKNSLHKMNLLELLLPNDVLMHIISFLNLKDISRFGKSSKKSNIIFNNLLLRTNFLFSKNPYAVDFMLMLKEAHFEPMPESIRLRRFVDVPEGSAQIRFRDSKHLESIADRLPLVTSKGRIYFVHDERVKDGNELESLKGKLKTPFFINVISNTPLKASGKISLPYKIKLPPKSNFLITSAGEISDELETFKNAHALANMIKNYDERLLDLRTKEAHQILEVQKETRLVSPQLFPNLLEISPRCFLYSESKTSIIQKDYIHARKQLFYIASTISGVEDLLRQFPECNKSICYIDSMLNKTGIYCSDQIFLRKGFEIFAKGVLSVAGEIDLTDYNLFIHAQKSLWLMGVSIKVKDGQTSLSTDSGYYILPLDPKFKPKGLPSTHWKALMNNLK